MSPAEFRTAHDALGVSTQFLAERIGVSVGRVWNYEHPERTVRVPERATEVIRDLLNDQAAAIERALETYAPHDGEGGVMPRYASGDDWRSDWPEFAGWPDTAQGAFLAALLQARPDLAIDYSLTVAPATA